MNHLPYIYFLGVLQVLIILPTFVKKHRYKLLKNKILILLLICIGVISSVYGLIFLQQRPVFLSNFPEIFWFGLNPLLYIYTKSLTRVDFKMTRLDYVAFTFSIYNGFQFILIKFEIYLTIGQMFDNQMHYLYLFLFAYLIHSLIFTVLSLIELKKYLKLYKMSESNSQLNARWLFIYQLCFFAVTLIFSLNLIYLITFDAYQPSYEFVLVLFFELFILIIAYKIVNEDHFLKALPNIKYSNSSLDKTILAHNEKIIQEIMTTQKPYLNPNFSLAKLAELTQLSENNLSQTFSQKLNTNFYDFINKYRVDEAKERFQNPEFQNYKIISIANDSGFNSKASFYRIFKKECNMTPTEFLKQVAG